MANKDGLEPGKPVDFETLQRIKREHREAAKNAKAEPKGKGRGRSKGTEDVRQSGESGVSGVVRSKAEKGSEGS